MIILGIKKLIACGIIVPLGILADLTGVDKTKIANREFRKEKFALKDFVNVDALLSKGYEESTVMALLGQKLINMSKRFLII